MNSLDQTQAQAIARYIFSKAPSIGGFGYYGRTVEEHEIIGGLLIITSFQSDNGKPEPWKFEESFRIDSVEFFNHEGELMPNVSDELTHLFEQEYARG